MSTAKTTAERTAAEKTSRSNTPQAHYAADSARQRAIQAAAREYANSHDQALQAAHNRDTAKIIEHTDTMASLLNPQGHPTALLIAIHNALIQNVIRTTRGR